MSLADRLRDLLGKENDPAEDAPSADPDEDDEDDEDDDAGVYPLW